MELWPREKTFEGQADQQSSTVEKCGMNWKLSFAGGQWPFYAACYQTPEDP